jgi:hypothetical protein
VELDLNIRTRIDMEQTVSSEWGQEEVPAQAGAQRSALAKRLRLGAFSALAVAMAAMALHLAQGPTLPKPGSSMPEAAPIAQKIAQDRWGFYSSIQWVDAPGIKTAKAAMRGGVCTIWRDGDIASAAWWRSMRENAGLYVDLHEMAHCQEEGTPGYQRRKASLSSMDMARAREVYADAMAFSALGPKTGVAGLGLMAKAQGDAHDSGFAARCLESILDKPELSDESRAQGCADQSVGLAPTKASFVPRRAGRS